MDGIGVLAEAFSGTGALERDGRLALARVLMCRPAELDTASLGDLPDTRHRRRLCTALSNGAEAEPVRERWSDSALTDLFPAAARLGDGDVLCRGAPRLLALLGRERAHRWPALLALRIGEIEGWTNAEPKTVAEVVGVAFERSLVGVLRRAGPSREAD